MHNTTFSFSKSRPVLVVDKSKYFKVCEYLDRFGTQYSSYHRSNGEVKFTLLKYTEQITKSLYAKYGTQP